MNFITDEYICLSSLNMYVYIYIWYYIHTHAPLLNPEFFAQYNWRPAISTHSTTTLGTPQLLDQRSSPPIPTWSVADGLGLLLTGMFALHSDSPHLSKKHPGFSSARPNRHKEVSLIGFVRATPSGVRPECCWPGFPLWPWPGSPGHPTRAANAIPINAFVLNEWLWILCSNKSFFWVSIINC